MKENVITGIYISLYLKIWRKEAHIKDNRGLKPSEKNVKTSFCTDLYCII